MPWGYHVCIVTHGATRETYPKLRAVSELKVTLETIFPQVQLTKLSRVLEIAWRVCRVMEDILSILPKKAFTLTVFALS